MRTTTWLSAVALTAALTVGACGSDEAGDGPVPALGADAPEASDDLAADVPDECRTPFPTAFTAVDLADVELLPDSWPDPPGSSTLCTTTGTIDGSQETAGYATELDAEQVLTAYESSLGDGFTVSREEDGIGRPMLVGTGADLSFQITPDDGRFTVTFVAGDL